MRLIDADAINTKTFVDFVGNQGYISFGDALWMISELPTIEAVPVVTGEWKVKTKGDFGYIVSTTCSLCGYSNDKKMTNFCPNCGADMRGEKNERNTD